VHCHPSRHKPSPSGQRLVPLHEHAVFMVRVQRRFWSWGLRMRIESVETTGFMESIV
jgi:hypothetical protein